MAILLNIAKRDSLNIIEKCNVLHYMARRNVVNLGPFMTAMFYHEKRIPCRALCTLSEFSSRDKSILTCEGTIFPNVGRSSSYCLLQL